VLGQEGFHLIEQFRACEQVEEGIGITLLGTATNAALLLRIHARINMHGGWLLG